MTTMIPTAPTSVFSDADPFARYRAELTFTGRLVGGNPSDPALVEGWLERNLGITDEEQLKRWTMKHLSEVHGIDPSLATDEEIEAAVKAGASEKKAQVFKRLPDGRPYIEPRQIKAGIKEAASISYPAGTAKFGQYENRSGKTVGGKAARDYVAERVFVVDDPVVVGLEVDGVEVAVGHIKDPRTFEKRSTIGYFEYVERPILTVEILALDDCLAAEQWARIWTILERNGIGARRSQGSGQFVVTKWEEVMP